jgi:hypothetical protein
MKEVKFFPMVQQPLVILHLLIIEASRSHSDTPHSVGLHCTSDQLVAETSTWQHTTLTRDRHAHGEIRTHNPSKRAAVDPRLRPRGHWDRQEVILAWKILGHEELHTLHISPNIIRIIKEHHLSERRKHRRRKQGGRDRIKCYPSGCAV